MDTNQPAKPQNASGVPADEAEVTPEARQAGHETSDVSIKGLFIFGVALFSTLLVVLVAVGVFYKGFYLVDRKLDAGRAQVEPGAASIVEATPDYQGPLLQVKPEEDLRWMREHVEMDLNSYGWVDRTRGVVRLPIDRAMDLVVARGLPPVSPGKTLEELQRQKAQPQVWGQSLRP